MKRIAAIVAACFLALPVAAADFEIPCEVYGKRKAIILKVVLNGKKRTFLLDTGAARTVVSPSALGASALDRFYLKLSRFNTNGPGLLGEALWGKANSLRIGQRVWYDRPVVVMNLKKVSQVYGRRIDGLLGQDILSEFDLVVIDFKNRKIVFTH